MRFIVSKAAAPKFKQNLAGLADRFEQALITAANMAASMIEAGARAGIAQAGNFGGSWISGLNVRVEGSLQNMRISMTHEDPHVLNTILSHNLWEQNLVIYHTQLN